MRTVRVDLAVAPDSPGSRAATPEAHNVTRCERSSCFTSHAFWPLSRTFAAHPMTIVVTYSRPARFLHSLKLCTTSEKNILTWNLTC